MYSWLVDFFAILDVDPPDLSQSTLGCAVVCYKLRNDLERFGRVYFIAVAVEIVVAETIRVDTAPGFVTYSIISTRCARAGIESSDIAGVWGQLRCGGVGLPKIHLVAAGTMGVANIGNPVQKCGSIVTLRIAVPSSYKDIGEAISGYIKPK